MFFRPSKLSGVCHVFTKLYLSGFPRRCGSGVSRGGGQQGEGAAAGPPPAVAVQGSHLLMNI